MVTRGQCLLKTKHSRIQLFAGDIIVFPFGTSHWLADREESNRINGSKVVEDILNQVPVFHGEEISTTLICGHFEFDRNLGHPCIDELPDLIHIKDSERKALPWLEIITDLIAREASSEEQGGNLIINKLGEVLFIHTLRAYLVRNKHKHGFYAGLQDNRISSVLKEIHKNPQTDWQLSVLGQIAGMSRTGFSTLFKEITGTTPMTYITNWRIINAKELLSATKKSVGEIASHVGYQSEAAFNRVFKKYVSQTPLKYRQSVLIPRNIAPGSVRL
jgi:AraC-like DNA-binding protein